MAACIGRRCRCAHPLQRRKPRRDAAHRVGDGVQAADAHTEPWS